MPVVITQYYPNGSADFVHTPDVAGQALHAGYWTPAEVQANTAFQTTRNASGAETPWLGRMTVTCSVCGATTSHPVGGGSHPERVQRMFITKLKDRQPGRSWKQAETIAKALLNADGGGGWVLPDDAPEEDPGGTHRPGGLPGVPVSGPASGLPGAGGDAGDDRAP